MFRDRIDAGRQLAARLGHYSGKPNTLVLALPRGGVPIGYEVAHALNAPLDVFIVRKLGVPWQEEMAMGAIAQGDILVLNEELIRTMRISQAWVDRVTEREGRELNRRMKEYRGDLPPPDVRGKTVILVDDGLATGTTMRAAMLALRKMGPEKIVMAVPLGAADICKEFRSEAEEVICLSTPEPFVAVGAWYSDFGQVTDREVRAYLAKADAEYRKHV